MEGERMTTAAEHAYEAAVLERAIDLALNDCQVWDNLPASVQAWYRAEALAELALEDAA
jgi:hypothetical protein